jgi:hypothetical protein
VSADLGEILPEFQDYLHDLKLAEAVEKFISTLSLSRAARVNPSG